MAEYTSSSITIEAAPADVMGVISDFARYPDWTGEVKEAARGMGMTGVQQFWRVELPLGLPLVVSGLRLALVQVWATATIAALVAGTGLGQVITDGFFRSNYGKGIAGALVVAAVALVLELVAALVQRAVDPTRRGTSGGRRKDALSVNTATVDEPAESVG